MDETGLEYIRKMETELGKEHANLPLMREEDIIAYAEMLANIKG